MTRPHTAQTLRTLAVNPLSPLSALVTPPPQTYLCLCGETIFTAATPSIKFMVVKRQRPSWLRSHYALFTQKWGLSAAVATHSAALAFSSFSARSNVKKFSLNLNINVTYLGINAGTFRTNPLKICPEYILHRVPDKLDADLKSLWWHFYLFSS